jgi:cytoskeletal protein RodZ
MPLDTGTITELNFGGDANQSGGPAETLRPTVLSEANIGLALKAVREASGLSLEDVAETTCVRRAYLAAIEDMRLDQLPSRPFTVGYIRAYAKALGLDGEAAVDRFKIEEPAGDQGLREPIGVQEGRDPRLALVGVAGALIVAAILIWNVAQRALAPAPKQTAAASAAAPAVIDRSVTAKAGPVALGAPLPPPVESTTPAPYETPGLAAATAADGSADASEAAAKLAKANKPQTPAPPPADLPATFASKGAIFGASAENSVVTLQARKPASIIVRGPDGSVYFARQLAAGEAYRAPQLGGLSVDAAEPDSIQVFVAGQSKGVLPSPKLALGDLAE